MAPALGALVKAAPEKPTMFTTWATPGVASTSFAAFVITSLVRESEAPPGSCEATMR